MKNSTYEIELKVLKYLAGKFASVTDPKRKRDLVGYAAKTISPGVSEDEINEIFTDIENFTPLGEYLSDELVEDIMVNSINNIFVYKSVEGEQKVDKKFENKEQLAAFVDKMRLYSTSEVAHGNIADVHLPNGSRANIVSSPHGYNVTIRNFRQKALSVLDLINLGAIDYQIAARLWIYMDGFSVRPANILIGGMPASGKTSLLNAMFSYFRPETRVVVIEDTYELNTETQENCARLETSEDISFEMLVKNALRMRPDTIIIGEVRGAEANDMLAAMNIGKICLGTMHASTARDAVTRLSTAPMNAPTQLISAVDAIMITSRIFQNKKMTRKIVQIAEISGVETQVLLSDLYRFDFKSHQAAPVLPSVTYRDTLAKLLGILPQDILEEEKVRANLLLALNKQGVRDLRGLNGVVKAYYENPQSTLNKYGLSNMRPVIEI